jgi:hypothetical protein
MTKRTLTEKQRKMLAKKQIELQKRIYAKIKEMNGKYLNHVQNL